jgi:hypothetical protein
MQALRVSFEAARTAVAVAESEEWHSWYADRLGWLFGPAVEQEFRETRARLVWATGEPNRPVEQGRWRARFDDLLADRPERQQPLDELTGQARYALVGRFQQLSA